MMVDVVQLRLRHFVQPCQNLRCLKPIEMMRALGIADDQTWTAMKIPLTHRVAQVF